MIINNVIHRFLRPSRAGRQLPPDRWPVRLRDRALISFVSAGLGFEASALRALGLSRQGLADNNNYLNHYDSKTNATTTTAATTTTTTTSNNNSKIAAAGTRRVRMGQLPSLCEGAERNFRFRLFF